MTLTAWFGVVIAYGTTGRAARRFGAGSRADAVAEGVQASWLALAVGVPLLVIFEVFAEPIAGTLAGSAEVAGPAAGWLRVAGLGIPFLLPPTPGNRWVAAGRGTPRPPPSSP